MYELELYFQGESKQEVLEKLIKYLAKGKEEIFDDIEEPEEDEIVDIEKNTIDLNEIARSMAGSGIIHSVDFIHRKAKEIDRRELSDMYIGDCIFNKKSLTKGDVATLIVNHLDNQECVNTVKEIYNNISRSGMVAFKINDILKIAVVNLNNDKNNYRLGVECNGATAVRDNLKFDTVIAIIELLSIASSLVNENALSNKYLLSHVVNDMIKESIL